MESALRPPLPTATRAFAEIQIQARLTNRSGQNIITSIRGSRCQVADIKSESRPASNRNRWPASGRNAWPASSESAVSCQIVPQEATMLEYGLRFLAGGIAVSAFAALGDSL